MKGLRLPVSPGRFLPAASPRPPLGLGHARWASAVPLLRRMCPLGRAEPGPLGVPAGAPPAHVGRLPSGQARRSGWTGVPPRLALPWRWNAWAGLGAADGSLACVLAGGGEALAGRWLGDEGPRACRQPPSPARPRTGFLETRAGQEPSGWQPLPAAASRPLLGKEEEGGEGTVPGVMDAPSRAGLGPPASPRGRRLSPERPLAGVFRGPRGRGGSSCWLAEEPTRSAHALVSWGR